MEVDLTIVDKEEIDFWCEEYPDLEREEVKEILECIEMDRVKDEFWKANPNLDEKTVNGVVAKAAAASYEHHLYHEFNNEAP